MSYRVAVELASSIPDVDGAVQAAVTVVLSASLRDEGVGVDPLTGLAILGRRRCSSAQNCFLVVLFQVTGIKRLAEGQLFWVPDSYADKFSMLKAQVCGSKQRCW